jgi:hypothetical protein
VKTFQKYLAVLLSSFLVALIVFVNPNSAFAGDEDSMDVRNLQTCLKGKGASLDVLVLMDSSRSLRNPKKGETDSGSSWTGSDIENRRGPILLSSLNLLQDLAKDSGSAFRINLKNFGNNSGKDLDALKSKWIEWTEVTPGNSENVLNNFVERALFNDSPGTDWAQGLATARVDFNKRISEAKSAGTKSCSVMFWITDGVPSAPKAQVKDEICKSDLETSIDWFREQNILVLGGLLKPKGKDSSLFRPIVTGLDCGKFENQWTKGYVIEAEDINSLAWEFVSLVANIRNLVNLDFRNGNVQVDRGTSQMEIYIKGEPSQWEVKAPDGSVFCSSSNLDSTKCVLATGKTGITTISITPSNPNTTQGSWAFSSLPATEVKVYGGISVEPNPVKLVVDPVNQNVNEGNRASFSARLENADGSPFDISSFRSVKICATLESNGEEVCKSGSGSAVLELLPSKSDTTVPFTAVITSNNGEDRQYNVSAVVNVLVQESGKFPSLVCGNGSEGDACRIPDLKNKLSKESVQLKVLKPTDSNAVAGQVYIVDIEVTRDDFARNFKFVLTDENGNVVNPGDKMALFNPNDSLKLQVSFDKGGKSQIEGVIKYAVVAGDQIVIRQLDFGFNVGGGGAPPGPLILLLLAAYLLTIAIPYAFLLWSARRNAVLAPPDDEFSYLITPITITSTGKVVFPGDIEGSSSIISHNNLTAVQLDARTRMTTVGGVQIKAEPPKSNPLARSKVLASISDSQILTTYGNGTFESPDAIFTPNLVKEAILHFPTEINFAPTVNEQIEANDNPFAVSTYENEIERSLSVRSGDLNGQAIFFVISSENRRIALRDLKLKIQNLGEDSNLLEQIKTIRENSLKAYLEAAESKAPPTEVEKTEGPEIGETIEDSDKRSGLWD